ncbi:MAG: hypothetical protein A3G23_14365 [Bacteroidetes bacterium RIFCSPLOWO2_12_FULL_37_12]|nr:MAG: hypothetical protein A3G23_14365 [Bacteroidetes bacterium RIFCSPLOWO2_12_FULL_37_12]
MSKKQNMPFFGLPDIYDLYQKMHQNNVMLTFKGEVTSELISTVLQIIENKLEQLEESVKVKKKVFNVLVECLQNLYHHVDEIGNNGINDPEVSDTRSAILMIWKEDSGYYIVTGNHLLNENAEMLRNRLDKINALDKAGLENLYNDILSNSGLNSKGGGGLGIIDIARRTGQKLEYYFQTVNDVYSFFSLKTSIITS